jgi:GTPase Era involved in 16S rRNA processing/gas vesicle protein
MVQYAQEKEQLQNCSLQISKLCREANFADLERKNEAILTHLINNKFYITIVGEFNRGKSTLVNAFLRADIIPTAIRETTATINLISYAKTPYIAIVDKEGNHKPLAFSNQALKEYTALTDFDPSTVDHIELGYPALLLQNDIILVDTPGVNDINEQRAEITYGFMPLSDATIFLLDSQKPFTATEQTFLKDRVLKNNISTMFFIVNKIDYLDISKHNIILQNVRQKLTATLGSEPTAIFPLSSDLALKGILEDDNNKLQQSKFPEFEEELIKFLSSNERTKAFLRKVRNNLADITRLFLDEIDTELSQNAKTLDELLSQQKTLAASESTIRSEFDQIVKYLSIDQEAISSKIETSLLRKFKELHEILSLEIEDLRGNLTEYGEKYLPLKIKQAIKFWIEQNVIAIEDFITFSMTNAAQAFETSFTKKPILNRLNEGFEDVGVPIKKIGVAGDEMVKQVDKYVQGAGVAFFGILGILSGGVSMVTLPLLGWSTGKGLSPLFTKKIVAEQKQELLSNLPIYLRETESHILKELKDRINNYYSSIKEQLQKEFDSTLKQIKSELKSRIDNFSKQQTENESNRVKLEKLKLQMIEVQQELLHRSQMKDN